MAKCPKWPEDAHLAIISVIFMPLNLIAGIHGMNFRYMAGFIWSYAYPLVIAVMFALVMMLLLIFFGKGGFK